MNPYDDDPDDFPTPPNCNCGSPATGGEASFPDLIGIDHSTFPPIGIVEVHTFFLCSPCLEFASDFVEWLSELAEILS